MALRDISLKLSYNSGEDDLVRDFYHPCLRNSIRYERAVGFFTSKILLVLSEGISQFLLNDGSMKLICSPRFNEEDINAIKKGYENRENLIEGALMREINQIPEDIVNNNLNCLSWLIANNKLDIKIALPTNIDTETYGIYHEKIGIFYDEEDSIIAFSGSQNETLYGVAYNYESFDIYRSWKESERCNLKITHFEKMWDNIAQGIEIHNFPEAAKDRIIEKITPQKYSEVNTNSVYTSLKKISSNAFLESLWNFQREAIDSWKDNGFSGILSMATGTGKTKTAIGAIIELHKSVDNIFVVVASPQNTILKQWEQEADSVDLFNNFVVADSTNKGWINELADKVIDFNENHIKNCIVYTTYNTLSGDKFVKTISNLKGNTLLICDEVHWAGANTFQKGLLPNFKSRLGLSATPKRHMDETGSDLIMTYFGKATYEFSLAKALTEINPLTGESFLCPYNYYPIFTSLNGTELEDYKELSLKIKKQYAKERESEEKSVFLQRLYEKRQAIIVNANSKYDTLNQLLSSSNSLRYMLIYCSDKQIDGVQDILNKKRIKNHRFTGNEGITPQKEFNSKSERDYILLNFENGTYWALVAMKCLDEGINIPRSEIGILMASSGNPKQYIQRRGRLLRRHKDKEIVSIYDILIVPYLDKKNAQSADEMEVKILEKEFIRYEEFANLASNKLEAMNKIFAIKDLYSYYDKEGRDAT